MSVEWVTIGDCRLACGDCLEILPTLEPGSVDAVVTDPPYSSGGAFRGDRTQKTVSKYVQTTSIETCRIEFTGDNRDQRSFLAWSMLWFMACHVAAKPGAVACCFTDWRQLPTLTDAMQGGGWVWRNIATWWKPGIRMQKGRFSSSAEYVIYGSHGLNTDGERSPQNVFACAPVDGEEKVHIAEKPLDVVEWVLGVTKAGGVVLDPFMGSGTTAMACLRMARPFVGIERDRRTFDIACRRIEDAYGKGSLFDDTKAESVDMFAGVSE